MSDDWQAGDLALCIKQSAYVKGVLSYATQPSPSKGRIYQVEDVKAFPDWECVGLKIPGWVGWIADHYFRKIRPHSADAEDRETIRLLNGAPVGEPA